MQNLPLPTSAPDAVRRQSCPGTSQGMAALEKLLERIIRQKPVSEMQLEKALKGRGRNFSRSLPLVRRPTVLTVAEQIDV
jgi:hypothetical protein